MVVVRALTGAQGARSMVEISENAAKLIKKMTARNGIPEGGLRIGIKAGGCSGLSYVFAWEAAARDGDHVQIHVVDQGPGVSPDVLPRLFDRFVSGQGPNGGLGLGLYLAKRIAALHGGDLTVESEPGKGARFTLMLPALPE